MSYNSKIKEEIPTYAQTTKSVRTVGGIPREMWVFNWFEALKQKIADPSNDELDDELALRSGMWETCACGNMCAVIPRNESDGEPHDYKLKQLGFEFTSKVEDAVDYGTPAVWQEALRIFERIEERSFELLLEMGVITMKGVYTQRWLKKTQKEEAEAWKKTQKGEVEA
jgi:hypothetical protein